GVVHAERREPMAKHLRQPRRDEAEGEEDAGKGSEALEQRRAGGAGVESVEHGGAGWRAWSRPYEASYAGLRAGEAVLCAERRLHLDPQRSEPLTELDGVRL